MFSTLKGRDIISINELTPAEINSIVKLALELKKKPQPNLLAGKVMGSCFFEPSTRTRLSFETAMQRLGGKVVGFADAGVTSAKKGETLYDSIKIVGQYVDVVAMRHPLEGAARRAAEATDKPVINGGDGANQHPTQTLLDLMSIKETQGKLNNLSIAMMGDLKYGRTVHSLAQALTHFNARLYFIAPPSLAMPEYLLTELREKGIKFSVHESFENIIPKLDVLYMTRIQGERFPDQMEYNRVKDVYRLTVADLKNAKKNLRILHPLPRVNEIDYAVDKTPHAYYFEQAENGLYARQALLALVLNAI
ncbi:MAG: aspartate carbamoyltransferase [Candidatus Magasanikbacteria bacterium RIFOXYC2_FULL_42_28]|uniref:Aspartate carbamoyltransferase n=1 Tax=Candidatus Magasanikbacteria bacterium RIFOXYC2_FULL_42_28 TaxID=1798704 RepID=A0A1F6NV12_9BACT|nr:MAG: aspartate carbamoyltransferase [Candidatus Magasanikbacteria bacterium RIFOXYC2_FULL_42_28]